jgi:hypothetical protein
MKNPYTHSSREFDINPRFTFVGENQASLCSALCTWSLNLAKHQEGFLASLPGTEEKEVLASTSRQPSRDFLALLPRN